MRRHDLCHAIRQRLERLPEPYAAHYGVVPPPPPEDAVPLGQGLASHQRATEALARINMLAGQMGDPYLVSRLLSRREAVSSSSIEGTHSTLDELLTLEEADDEQRNAVRQVRDYAFILDQLVPRAMAQGPTIFTAHLFAELHRAVMKREQDYGDLPGVPRSCVVWIGGNRADIAYSTYNPTPPGRITACLDDSIAYLRAEGMQAMTQSLIARMAIAHAHFEAVHPYRDGNGRVGRLLLPLMMAADGKVPVYLSPYIEAHKPAYYGALQAAQQRLNWAAMVAFVADAITGTVDELMATRAALVRLGGMWRAQRRYREKSAALRALALLPDYPVLTARRLGERLGVSAPAVNTAIAQLVEAGVLVERTGYRRNRVFVAQDVLRVLNRPFGAEPIVD